MTRTIWMSLALIALAGCSSGSKATTSGWNLTDRKIVGLPQPYIDAYLDKCEGAQLAITDDMTKEDEGLVRQVANRYADVARAMPRNGTGPELMQRSKKYFEGDIIDIWITFHSSTETLKKEGIEQDAAALIESAVEAMETLGVPPGNHKRPREFCALYETLREDHKMSHEAAIAEIIRLRKFGPGEQ